MAGLQQKIRKFAQGGKRPIGKLEKYPGLPLAFVGSVIYKINPVVRRAIEKMRARKLATA